MKAVDRFYTPSEIAAKMIEEARCKRPSYIADFAAGDGELLRAASKRWPRSKFIATDLSQANVSFLRRTVPKWKVGRCDFLKPESRKHCKALNQLSGKIPLILLNPPFSCRGGKRWSVEVNTQTTRCGLAMAFVLTSIPFLTSDGQIIAVMPSGCLTSDKDREAWDILNSFGQSEIIKVNGHRTFVGCFPRTVIVRFTMSANKNSSESSVKSIRENPTSSTQPLKIHVIRGRVQMHTVDANPINGSLPLVHSTELRDGKLYPPQYQANNQLKGIRGPAILLPRVGQPNRSKVVLYPNKHKIVLSDCVIALKCKSKSEAHIVQSTLLQNWPVIEQKYGGTGARYITISSLSSLLEELGFSAKIYRSSKNNTTNCTRT